MEEWPRKNEYVFASRGKTGHIRYARKTLLKISEVAEAEVRAHDFRRTFRAIGDGLDIWKIKLLMNHKISDITISSYTETPDLSYLAPEAVKIAARVEQAAAKEPGDGQEKLDNF